MGVHFKDPRNAVMNDRERGGLLRQPEDKCAKRYPPEFSHNSLLAFRVRRETDDISTKASRGQTGAGRVIITRVNTVSLAQAALPLPLP